MSSAATAKRLTGRPRYDYRKLPIESESIHALHARLRSIEPNDMLEALIIVASKRQRLAGADDERHTANIAWSLDLVPSLDMSLSMFTDAQRDDARAAIAQLEQRLLTDSRFVQYKPSWWILTAAEPRFRPYPVTIDQALEEPVAPVFMPREDVVTTLEHLAARTGLGARDALRAVVERGFEVETDLHLVSTPLVGSIGFCDRCLRAREASP